MSNRYKYGHRPGKHRTRFVAITVAVVFAVLAGTVFLVIRDIRNNQAEPVIGTTRSVSQALGVNSDSLFIDEPLFTMELPADWKEIERKNNDQEQSITWQATLKNEDNRSLKLYIDRIPSDIAINRLLPVAGDGSGISYGQLSDNCSAFTGGGTFDTTRLDGLKPSPAKWQNVDFICDLPNVINNKVGTGSAGSLNTTVVNGPTQGSHKYFFLYTDHNVRPNYSILYDALRSFRAK